MGRDFSLLDEYISKACADGYLIEADSGNSDQYYLTGVEVPDSFISLYAADGATHLLVASMEANRARRESRAESVSKVEDYGGSGRIRYFGTEENREVLVSFLRDHSIESVVVPAWFPLGTADGLRAEGVDVTPENEGLLQEIRATKTPEEIEHVRTVQAANERALRAAEEALASAEVRDGRLVLDGETLTSDRLREEIEITLFRHGCAHATHSPIVACAADAADPHARGDGPLLANETVLIDISPRHKKSKFFGDITRTFVKGEPTVEQIERYDVVREALDAALDAIEPGLEAVSVHDAACDVIEDAGYRTIRSHPGTDTGFVHRTGHGIGLDIHENPRLSQRGGTLKSGNVVTVEPGLYDPAVGGVRIEDLVVVTEDGHENLTSYPKSLDPAA